MIRHKDYLLAEVPEDASKMKVWDGPPRLQYFVGNHPIYEMIHLPPGTWQLIGLASELTEEQWREIVEELGQSLVSFHDLENRKSTILILKLIQP